MHSRVKSVSRAQTTQKENRSHNKTIESSISHDTDLHRQAPSLAKLILTDEVVRQLNQNQISKQFLSERVIEICHQALLQPDLVNKLEQSESSLKQAQAQHFQFQKQLDQMEQSFTLQQQENQQQLQWLDKLNQELSLKCKAQEQSMELKQSQVSQMEQELQQVKRLYQLLQDDFGRVKAQLQSARVSSDSFHSANQKNEQIIMDLEIQVKRLETDLDQSRQQLVDEEAAKQVMLSKFEMFGEHLAKKGGVERDAVEQRHKRELFKVGQQVQGYKTKCDELASAVHEAKDVQLALICQFKTDMRIVQQAWEQHKPAPTQIDNQHLIQTNAKLQQQVLELQQQQAEQSRHSESELLIQRAIKEHAWKLKEIQSDHVFEIKKLTQQWQLRLGTVQAENTRMKQEIESMMDLQFDTQRMEAQCDEYKAQLTQLQSKLKQQESHKQTELNRAQFEIQDLQSQFEQKLLGLQSKHQRDLSQLKMTCQQQLGDLKSGLQTVRGLVQQQSTMPQEMLQLQQKRIQELEQLVRQSEEKNRRVLQSQGADIQQLIQDHQLVVDLARQEVARTYQTELKALKKMVIEVKTKYSLKIQEHVRSL